VRHGISYGALRRFVFDPAMHSRILDILVIVTLAAGGECLGWYPLPDISSRESAQKDDRPYSVLVGRLMRRNAVARSPGSSSVVVSSSGYSARRKGKSGLYGRSNGGKPKGRRGRNSVVADSSDIHICYGQSKLP
jgi:hypothetical protein